LLFTRINVLYRTKAVEAAPVLSLLALLQKTNEVVMKSYIRQNEVCRAADIRPDPPLAFPLRAHEWRAVHLVLVRQDCTAGDAQHQRVHEAL